jgi:hypothetical protein
MKISIDRSEIVNDVRNVTIFVNNVGFKISVNKFYELVLNKIQYQDGESSIVIKPSVSNEVRIT